MSPTTAHIHLSLPCLGLSGSTSRLQQSSTIAPYVTLRRGLNAENSSATFSVSGHGMWRDSHSIEGRAPGMAVTSSESWGT